MQLDRIVFLGRTLKEYVSMFSLRDEDLRSGRVLNCPSGPSSFGAEAAKEGVEVTSCDVLYHMDAPALARMGREDIEHVFERFDSVSERYVWSYYRNQQEVISLRERALGLFHEDYEQGKADGRYVEAKLPELPFPDGHFALTLSSHFLFMYGEWLPMDFHLAALREMLRVTQGEVRVFPLLGLDGKPYDYLSYILMQLAADGVTVTIRKVPFEFLKGGNVMLTLRNDGGDL
jgi:hypothetical protein